MKSLRDLKADVLRSIPFNATVERDLRQALAYYRDALENRDGAFQADEIAAHRLKLAAVGLRLSQMTIPSLIEISAEILQTAGADAIQTACKPTRGGWNDREFPSEFTLPSEFGGIVARATAAVRGLAGK